MNSDLFPNRAVTGDVFTPTPASTPSTTATAAAATAAATAAAAAGGYGGAADGRSAVLPQLKIEPPSTPADSPSLLFGPTPVVITEPHPHTSASSITSPLPSPAASLSGSVSNRTPGGGASSVASGPPLSPGAKRRRRLEKNREIARNCRKRKRERMNDLEEKVHSFRARAELLLRDTQHPARWLAWHRFAHNTTGEATDGRECPVVGPHSSQVRHCEA